MWIFFINNFFLFLFSCDIFLSHSACQFQCPSGGVDTSPATRECLAWELSDEDEGDFFKPTMMECQEEAYFVCQSGN